MRATGGSLTSEMKTALSKVKTGDKIYVERIEASVAGERRPLPSISLKVQ
jgi:sortase (surface protein transpeptidase)